MKKNEVTIPDNPPLYKNTLVQIGAFAVLAPPAILVATAIHDAMSTPPAQTEPPAMSSGFKQQLARHFDSNAGEIYRIPDVENLSGLCVLIPKQEKLALNCG